MVEKTYNVLFLCTGNSARSQMAECLLNELGGDRFRAFSAGSHPSGEVHPLALELLRRRHHDVKNLRSKNWSEFASGNAPEMDFVITVCDQAAGEVCPVWPGQPMTAHWGFIDPAAATGSKTERKRLFAEVYRELRARLEIFTSLPMDQLDRQILRDRIRAMGVCDNEDSG